MVKSTETYPVPKFRPPVPVDQQCIEAPIVLSIAFDMLSLVSFTVVAGLGEGARGVKKAHIEESRRVVTYKYR